MMSREKAFTLIEVIAILMAILPALRRAWEQSKATCGLNNMCQIGLAVHLYAQDNNLDKWEDLVCCSLAVDDRRSSASLYS